MMKKNVISTLGAISMFVLLILGSCRTYKEDPVNEELKTEEQRSFITVWETNKIDPSDKNITIPINLIYKNEYDYNIRWSKVNNPDTKGELLNNKDRAVVTFPAPGKYKIEISGKFPAIYFHSDTISRQNILSVEQWGNIKWKSMKSAFAGCRNLQIEADDAPDLSAVTDMSNMFFDAKSFNRSIEKWNVSNITNMASMFYGASSFNQPIEKWNVSGVTDMSHMFHKASSFNKPLDKWYVSKADNMISMFESATSFDQSLNKWGPIMRKDVKRDNMFKNAKSFYKKENIRSWGLNDDSCKKLFGGKC